MPKQPYTPQTYYKVTQIHTIFFVLGIGFALVGCYYTRDRVKIKVTKNETAKGKVTKNETAEGKRPQQHMPYWTSGFALAALNGFLALFSFGVYQHVTKGIYTEARKKAARDMDGLYRLIMMPATFWGIGGAVLTGMVGVCKSESDQTCYYVYTNFDINKGLAITLIVIHSLWFFKALEMCKTTQGVQNRIGTIRVGTNLETSSQPNSRPKQDAAPPRPPQSSTKHGAAAIKAVVPPPKAQTASSKAPQKPIKSGATVQNSPKPHIKSQIIHKKPAQPPPNENVAAHKSPQEAHKAPLNPPSLHSILPTIPHNLSSFQPNMPMVPQTPSSVQLNLPIAPPNVQRSQCMPTDSSIVPSAPPPSYEEAVCGPYTIIYTESFSYLQPQNLYSGSAFPDDTPSVVHANQNQSAV